MFLQLYSKILSFVIFFKNILLELLFPLSNTAKFYRNLTPEVFFASACTDIQAIEPRTVFSYGMCESLFVYHHPIVKDAIWQLKYRGNSDVARLCAILLYDHILELLAEGELFGHFKNPIIIPIPISKERMKERGWNQSVLIAKALEKIDRGVFFTVSTHILEKYIHTPPQTKLNRAERLSNLKNCFRILPNLNSENKNISSIKNRNIILLDDVTTTGSTLEAAASVLKAAGAKNIWALTVAH